MYREQNANTIPGKETLTEGMCPVKWALNVATVAREGNDGKNVMGRDGMTQLKQILTDLTTGSAEDDDLDLVRELCQLIMTTPGCEISAQAAENILWSLENNTMEWNNHRRKRCSTQECYQGAFGAAAAPEGRTRRRRRGASPTEE
jgi:NADH-quinone oxidoreductase subunit F